MVRTYKINLFVLNSSDIHLPAGASDSLIDIALQQCSLPKAEAVEQVVMIAVVIGIELGSTLQDFLPLQIITVCLQYDKGICKVPYVVGHSLIVLLLRFGISP